jgi:hypothetical protein
MTKCITSAGDCSLTLLRSPVLTVFLYSCAILFDEVVQNMIYGSERVHMLFLHVIHPDGCILFCFKFVTVELLPMLIFEYDFSKPFVPHREQCASVWNAVCCYGRVQHVTTLWVQNAVLRVKSAGALAYINTLRTGL